MKRLLPLLSILLLSGFKPATPPLPDVIPTGQDLVQLSLVDRESGRVLPRIEHAGQYWVPGERGHRYAVRLQNLSSRRVLVVVSVDGINAISGEQATPGQTGYVLYPWQATDITGWRKSNAEVAQFVFSSPGDSYAERTGRGDNLGVVGIAVFREKEKVRPLRRPVRPPGRALPASPAASGEALRDSVSRTTTQALGTGHGEREHSMVTDTHFVRATVDANQQAQLRYDSARNLRARGIVVAPYRQGRREPQAFPQRFVPDPPAR